MSKHRDKTTRSDEHNARGIELADRGWLDEAMREFKKAIELDPDSAHAHDNLATVLTEKGDFFEALQRYLKAATVDPENPSAYHYLATFLLAHGNELAISLYRKAIDMEPEFPEAHLSLAMALAEREQLDEAINELEIAREQAPDDELIQHELAGCLMDVERYPEAIGILKQIVKEYPEHVEAYVDLGMAYTRQGFFAEAESILNQALEIDAHDFSAHYQLASLYVFWDRRENAFKHLEIAARYDRERTKLWLRDDATFAPLHNDEAFLELFS